MNLVADLRNVERVECLIRRLRLAFGRAECREVVEAGEPLRRCVHRLDVELARIAPDAIAIQREIGAAADNPIKIVALDRRVARLECIRHALRIEHRNRMRPYLRVDGVAHDIRFPILRQIEAASRKGTVAKYPVYDASGNVIGERTADFTGIGDIDLTAQTARALSALAPEQARIQLAAAQQKMPSGQTLGEAFATQRLAELKALDPERYQLYSSFLKDIGTPAGQTQAVPEAPTYERVGMPTAPQDTGAAAQMRSDLERQVAAGLAQAGTLDPSLMRAAQQAVRARGTATGNILGNLQAFREANAVAQAIANADVQRDRKSTRLNSSH